jgi:hypothetical protein
VEIGTKKYSYLGLHDNYTLLALVAVDERTFDQYYDMLLGCLGEEQTLFSVELDFPRFKEICDSGLEPRFLNEIFSSKNYTTLKKLERKRK